MFVDTHVHLNMSRFDDDLEDVVERACAAGVEYMVDIGADLNSSRKAVSLSGRYASVFCCCWCPSS